MGGDHHPGKGLLPGGDGADPGAFQAGFARAYAARYASAPASIDPPEGAAPNAAVVASLILRTDGELTAEKHLSQFPFESWNN